MEAVKVYVGEEEREYPTGTTFLKIAKEFQNKFQNEIALAMVDNKLQELHKTVQHECHISFVTTKESAGNKAYKRSATLLMLKSFYDVVDVSKLKKVRVLYHLDNGYYCKVTGDIKINEELLKKLKNRMKELVERDIPIHKKTLNSNEAIEKFGEYGMHDKERLFKYRLVSNVNIYSIEKFEDYYYGYMVPSTGYLKNFDLCLFDEGFVLQFPDQDGGTEISGFQPPKKLFQVLKESTKWGEMIGIDTVGALNDKVADGSIKNCILIQEALFEKKIAGIVEKIIQHPDKKLIMIAGPSSSGKTTFSHRLSIQLMAQGLKPHPIPIDNYYLDRDQIPLDEHGERDFECLEALDIERFNKDMLALLAGECVEIPQFSFETGKREMKGRCLQLGKDDILVIEGIHGLNDSLSYELPKESKFKIYISALTQLNIDEHNRIPTTDVRLIRRIVRDARTRGTSAKETLSMWKSVRRGEERHIFPFQEQADIMINSALIYELAVLKLYADPLLFGIEPDEQEYNEAIRLLKFLDYFVSIPSESIPQNSIVREFIGGSCFKV
ncbi:nucleoside kinase [Anaerosacchariphilus polymeriproducens]|uniref:Nucleoside kinase n=1 Tax=Anaerosacchariphilus polymeriproducens TaxID=1812858 RepID=A0A371AXN3_9FIRM|nr:nucleoside kinase [Anaerosacchariphilus polymeriproducens]RDU24338.1 nucleoside kinase [Anaerosacchariphilus polymeriproducens]